MTQDHHTPIPFHSARTTAVLNAPLGQLDAAITNPGSGTDEDYAAYPPRVTGIFDGSYGAPITTVGPTVRITRHERIARASMTGPGDNDQNAGIHVFVFADADSEVQANAILGHAHGGPVYGGISADLLGVQGTADANNPGTNAVATGGYFAGTRHYDTAIAIGAEIRAENYTATDPTYNPDGASDVLCLWLTTSGDGKVGAFIQTGEGATSVALVGIGFTTGSVQDATFRDDTSSVRVLDINGAHTIGIDMTEATFSTCAVILPNGSTSGAIRAMNAAGDSSKNILYLDSSNNLQLGSDIAGVVYTPRQFSAGGGMYIGAKDIQTDTSTGTKFGTASNEKIGFWGATPIARPTGVAVTAAGIHAALVSAGIIAA